MLQAGPSPSPPPPQWRRAEFMASVRGAVSARQFDRFKRMYCQPFFVLAGEIAADELSFTVSGSEHDAYRLVLGRSTGRIACSCPDACVNCARLGCICKHACFLLYRVLRAVDVSPLSTRRLTPEQFDGLLGRSTQVVERLRTPLSPYNDEDEDEDGEDGSGDGVAAPAATLHGPREIDLLCDALERGAVLHTGWDRGGVRGAPSSSRGKQAKAKAKAFTHIARPPEPDDECPVCYDALQPAEGDLRGCPSCGRAVHARCARRWLAAAAPRAGCVYCRSPAWAEWDQL